MATPTVPITKDLIRKTEWQQQFIDDYWLNLYSNEEEFKEFKKLSIHNPFDHKTDYDIENPHIFVLDLMRKPENFHFTCRHLFNKNLELFQLAILQELWNRPFPILMGSRGMGKSFLLGLYATMRATLCQGSKIVICGAAFRQSKAVFDYAADVWDKSPILQDICSGDRRNGPRRDVDRCTLRIGDSVITALPIGDGQKIRGQRANITLADEFGSIRPDIFETVIRGFGAVSLDPAIKSQEEARHRAMKELGIWTKVDDDNPRLGGLKSNQTVISGTADYAFGHFCSYWKKHKQIIESKGDIRNLKDVFGEEIPEEFNWHDYSIVRIPYNLIPDGFMDKKNIAQAKANDHVGTFTAEFGCCFLTDSKGFFKRSTIESCVVGKPESPIVHACGEVRFSAVLEGRRERKYYIAVDPASENDNLSVVVLEAWPDHRRIVHCWTTRRSRYKLQKKKGITDEDDYYAYCARKIREIVKKFPCEVLSIDSQGGGIALMEALQSKKNLQEGETLILPIIDFNEPRDTDAMPGQHIIEVIQFAKADWVATANHGLRKDMEDKILLFPEFDTVVLGMAIENDKITGRVKVNQKDKTFEKLYDTLEDCFMEIEDLKDELACIEHTQTGIQMRDRWDVPEIKGASGKKGRLRKDRYSSLLMANMAARSNLTSSAQLDYDIDPGGFARDMHGRSKGKPGNGNMWISLDAESAWIANELNTVAGGVGMAVKKR